MFNLGFGEILVICVVLIIVVGPERLPSLMKNVGKAVRTVRQASREIQTSIGLDEIMREDVMYQPPRAPAPPATPTFSREAAPQETPAQAPPSGASTTPSAAPEAASATPAVPPANDKALGAQT